MPSSSDQPTSCRIALRTSVSISTNTWGHLIGEAAIDTEIESIVLFHTALFVTIAFILHFITTSKQTPEAESNLVHFLKHCTQSYESKESVSAGPLNILSTVDPTFFYLLALVRKLFGLHEYLMWPFEVYNGAATFQGLMQVTMSDLVLKIMLFG